MDDVTRDAQEFVKDTVSPIDNRLGDLADKVTWLHNTFVALEAKLDEPRTATANASSLPANLQHMINSPDQQHTTCDQKGRECLVSDFVEKTAPDLKLVLAGCVHKGPRDQPSLAPVAFAGFATTDDAKTSTDA